MFTVNYFQLKRGKTYRCSLDDPGFKGLFEYKLHKHYLVYRKIKADEERNEKEPDAPKGWRPVWNIKWYDDKKSCYQEVVWTKKKS